MMLNWLKHYAKTLENIVLKQGRTGEKYVSKIVQCNI